MKQSKIAILGAMREEIDPILKRVQNINKIEYAKNIYYEAEYKNKHLVIAYSKIGKVFSSLTTSILIEKFNCKTLLFSGVAGGINKNLKIGDLIIADKISQYDIDLTAFGHPFGYVPEGQIYIKTDRNLIDIADKISKNMNLKVKKGILATGDKFVSLKKKKEWIKEIFNADALDMESGSIAVVCNSLNIPFFIIRAISDNSEGNANIDFDAFLESSSKKSADFILNMVEKINI